MSLEGCSWLVRVLPDLATVVDAALPTWTLPPGEEQRLLFNAVARCMANVAGPAGTLLVLDDLQWTSTDALALLETLVRSAIGTPLRLLGAYRDVETPAGNPLPVLLADLAHGGLVAHLKVPPLTREEADQLLDSLLVGVDDPGPEWRTRLLEQVDGVPFFMTSYLQDLRMGVQHRGNGDAVPWNVAHSIRQRVGLVA